MEGEAVICYEKGWACSNDAAYVVERDIITGEDGKMYSKHTATIRVIDYFIKGERFGLGDQVRVAFKNSEDGTRTGYTAKVQGLTNVMAVFAITGKTEVKNIVDTIKKESYG